MKYRELLEVLRTLEGYQLDMDAVIYWENIDEFIPVKEMILTKETDVLDNGHPIFILGE